MNRRYHILSIKLNKQIAGPGTSFLFLTISNSKFIFKSLTEDGAHVVLNQIKMFSNKFAMTISRFLHLMFISKNIAHIQYLQRVEYSEIFQSKAMSIIGSM